MGIIDLVYPQRCKICGDFITTNSLKICSDCIQDFPFSYYWSWLDNPGYHLLNKSVNIERVISLMYYNSQSLWKGLISDFKYKGDKQVGILLSDLLANKMREIDDYRDIDLLIPVPLHWIKRVLRGYNQSAVIAKHISKVLRIPYNIHVLKRVKYSKTQTAKSRLERAKVIDNTYKVCNYGDSLLKNKHVLLIDDVMTTGATTIACAKELIKIEGCRVSVLTLATVE